MINFTLGYILGILTATFILVALVYFRKVIESKITVIQKQIETAGPRPRGFIVEPDSEADEVRADIIAKNRALGRDTKLEELE